MLKKFIVTAALMGVTAYSYGQGVVNFDTKAVGARVMFTVQGQPDAARNVTGNAPVTGGGGGLFYGQLYAAAGQNALEAALQPVGTRVEARGSGNYASANAGYFIDTTPVTVTSANGGPATVQLRAWTGAETYELAAAAAALNTKGSGAGASPLLNLSSTGNAAAEPPGTPVDLTGLQGFTFEVKDIPEPSTIALGVLGAAALIFARRRK